MFRDVLMYNQMFSVADFLVSFLCSNLFINGLIVFYKNKIGLYFTFDK